MQPEIKLPEAKPALCDPKRLLGPTLIAMLTESPKHRLVRAMVNRRCSASFEKYCTDRRRKWKPLPEQLNTIGEMMEWIQENIYGLKDGQLPPAHPEPDEMLPDEALVIPCTTTETEFGHCNYNCTVYGTAQVGVAREDLVNLLRRSTSWDDLWGRIRSYVSEYIHECVEVENRGNYQYDEWESEESDDFDWSFRRSQGTRSELATWIRNNLPDEAVRLGLLPQPRNPITAQTTT